VFVCLGLSVIVLNASHVNVELWRQATGTFGVPIRLRNGGQKN